MSQKPQLKRRGSWNGNDSPPMAPREREDFSLNRAELDSISGKELGRLMDSPPSGKMKAPKATDVEVNPETSGFPRRRGRAAKDMDVQVCRTREAIPNMHSACAHHAGALATAAYAS